jgi:putative ABC transport system permease protein
MGVGNVLVRLAPGNAQQALHSLEQVWLQVAPERSFEASFLDESLADLYRAETRLAKLIGASTFLAVLIACLGLFGLASFTAVRRTKEIGVRKVLGASVMSIIALLSTDFLKLVGIACLVATPLAYFAMSRWLENFAFHIALGPDVFLLTGVLVLLTTMLTVSYQAIRAALADPVKSLRYE